MSSRCISSRWSICSGKRITGFEALLRWRHPVRGMVSPADFIPLAEEIGLIIQIGEWVLLKACRHAASWPEPLKVAVNISPVQFTRSAIWSPAVTHALRDSGLDPRGWSWRSPSR